MSKIKTTYKVIFEHQDKIYEIYAKHISEGALMGFIELEELIFSENSTSTALIDPGEETLKQEFNDVKRSYIPLHSILRIDEMQKEGTPKIIDGAPSDHNIKDFPGSLKRNNDPKPNDDPKSNNDPKTTE